MSTGIKHKKFIYFIIHLIGWGIVFAFPFFFFERTDDGGFDWPRYVHHSLIPVSFLTVFYLNYFGLIPAFLFTGKTRNFILYNGLLVLVLSLLLVQWHNFNYNLSVLEKNGTEIVKRNPSHPGPPRQAGVFFLFRDAFSLILTISLSVAIRMSMRWTTAESARKEAERSRIDAELKNLRNQINPHFLLNTLNNIYALIAFDQDKAQEAVHDLSKLLRYILYENQQNYVPLHKEIEFIRNYIELMRIRLATHVTLETRFDTGEHSRQFIAPLIFISLIENAFKHGISPVENSFIKIHIREVPQIDQVVCEITNSNFPKTTSDKSGSGIGLEQVQKRLDLLYPGQYLWHKTISDDRKVYSSVLAISTQKQITEI